MLRRAVCLGLIAPNAASVAMVWLALERYSPFWQQPGARTYVAEALGMLLAYVAVLIWIMLRREAWWDTVLRTAAIFGGFTGCMEAANVASENGLLPAFHGAAAQVMSMLAVFAVWGVAGWRGARVLRSVRRGVATAALSAGVCMVLGVTAGIAIELFLAPPVPASVVTWGEYARSGWTDARAFGIANTLDSVWTHLLLGPAVAMLFGSLGAWLGSAGTSPEPGVQRLGRKAR